MLVKGEIEEGYYTDSAFEELIKEIKQVFNENQKYLIRFVGYRI